MIYLDYASTTPLHPLFLERMLPYFSEHFGNPSATTHPFGNAAAEAVEVARSHVAQLLGVQSEEIIFTSGATEAINLAIKGVFKSYDKVKGRHFISVKTEHKAVLNSLKALRHAGAEVTLLDVRADGTLDPQILTEAIRQDTVMAIIMYGNNETGVLHPLSSLASICHQHGVILFSDATQAVGKITIRPRTSGIHLLALSAHKGYGPKGIGALYISGSAPHIKIRPLLNGGGQEQGLRSGTLNVPTIVGMGAMAEWLSARISQTERHLQLLQTTLEDQLLERIEGVHINGSNAPRLPHITNITFDNTDAKDLLQQLESKLAIATGSACNTANLTPSHVLTAMGLKGEEAHRSLRISTGIHTTPQDITRAVDYLVEAAHRARDHKLGDKSPSNLSGDTLQWK